MSMDSFRKGSSSYGTRLLVVAPTPVGDSADRPNGERARSGAVLGGKARGGTQVAAKLWLRSNPAAAGESRILKAWLQVSSWGSTVLEAWLPPCGLIISKAWLQVSGGNNHSRR